MQALLALATRIETVVSEASLIEATEVIEYPAFVLAFPLHRLVLHKGTDFART
jgi:predicted nucleic acid-binding protein